MRKAKDAVPGLPDDYVGHWSATTLKEGTLSGWVDLMGHVLVAGMPPLAPVVQDGLVKIEPGKTLAIPPEAFTQVQPFTLCLRFATHQSPEGTGQPLGSFDAESAVEIFINTLEGGTKVQAYAGKYGGQQAWPQDGKPHVMQIVFDGADSLVRVDETERSADLGTNSLDGIIFNSPTWEPFQGVVGFSDVVLYDRVLSSEEMDSIYEELTGEVPVLPPDPEPEKLVFTPGHYFTITDDFARGEDGLAKIDSIISSYDLTNIAGFEWRPSWLMCEPGAKHDYDFSRIKKAMDKCREHGLKLWISVMERTFWNSDFAPDWIPQTRDTAEGQEKVISANMWEPEVMDEFIAMLQAFNAEHGDDPVFQGWITQETSNGPLARLDYNMLDDYYREIARCITAIRAPNRSVQALFNWPQHQDCGNFTPMVEALRALPAGGAYGWPDTIRPDVDELCWFLLGDEQVGHLILMPHMETYSTEATSEWTDWLVNIAQDRWKAQVVVWPIWHRDNSNYGRDIVIPAINKRPGVNTSTPWDK